MAQVFISYSRKDLSFVEKLSADLEAAGLDVWYDKTDLSGGSHWTIEIQNAIKNSNYFIVVLSPDSAISNWVEIEFLFASKHQRKIIPLMYRACDLPIYCMNLNYLDVQGRNYRREFPNLLQALGIKSSPAELPKKAAGRDMFTRNRKYFVSIIVAIAIALGVFIIPKINKLSQTPTTTPTFTPSIKITSTLDSATNTTQTLDISSLSISKVILLAKSDPQNRLEVTIYNPSERDILATSITIEQSYSRNYSGNPCSPSPLYELSQVLYLRPSPGGKSIFEGKVTPPDEAFGGYSFPFKGEKLENCSGGRSTLSFDVSLIVSKSSYTKFYIDIPSELIFTNTNGLGETETVENDGINFVPAKGEWGVSKYELKLTINTDYNKPISYILTLVH